MIRYGTVEDAPLIADMSRSTFHDTFAAHNTPENMHAFMEGRFSRQTLITEVENGKPVFMIAYSKEMPVGYAALRLDGVDQDSVEISRLYATKDAIGKGVGRALMERCMGFAREKGKKSIWLGVWAQNHRAIAFYQKAGFTKFGEHVFLLGDDEQIDWLMRRQLI